MSALPQLVKDLMIESEEEYVTSDEEDVPDFIRDEKPVIPHAEIFKTPIVQPVVEPVVEPIKKKNPNDKRKGRKMTEEHKQKMIDGRRKQAEKKGELAKLEKAAKEKIIDKKKKEYTDIINEVPADRPVADIDPDIIQKAIDEALHKNEMMRKSRKAEKRKTFDEELERRKTEEKIKQALYPAKSYYGDEGWFSQNIFKTR